MDHIRDMIAAGRTALGIELGSTRIKAVLIGEDSTPIAAGSHEWENRLENGVWTYTLDDVWTGLRHSYAEMAADVERQYGVKVERIGSMGFSAMMHGYMAFDEGGKLLVPFRTWRNTMTEAAAQELTELFHFNIPPALVHCPPLSGHPERGGACPRHPLPHHSGRVCPLAAQPGEGAGRGGGRRHVPH